MPNQYRVGARIERLAIALLKRNGYYTCRSAGSKGAFDIITWRKDDGGDMRCIQCKKAGSWGKGAFAKMEAIAVPPGAVRELWEWDGTGDWVCYVYRLSIEGWLQRFGVMV